MKTQNWLSMFVCAIILAITTPLNARSIDPQLIPTGVIGVQEHELDHVMMGPADRHHSIFNGAFKDKVYFYYEPMIDPTTGTGLIRFEVTSGDRHWFGTREAVVGVVVNYLDENRKSIKTLHHRVKIDKPGIATAYPANEGLEFWSKVKRVHLRWYREGNPEAHPTIWPIWNTTFSTASK